MSRKKLRVAVVGLRFGGCFPDIYKDHPDVEYVGICDSDSALLKKFGDEHGIERRHSDYREILASDQYDAVHLVTPIPSHGRMSAETLESGKHCACTVPMATSLEDIAAIVAARKKSGKNYMMMETSVYTHHCLYARELAGRGGFGRIQFLRGAHYQDMEHWPSYWMGLPPMHYATHAVAPLLAVSGSRATRVHCYGSGYMRPELRERYGNPFPIETAIVRLDKENLSAEVTRSLFHTVRSYMESFNVYGDKASFEWHMEEEFPVMFTVANEAGPYQEKDIVARRVAPPDFSRLLPPEIARHSLYERVSDPANPLQFVKQGGGHHGSHPHMVHEFLRSIVEEREPWIDARRAANWTAVGICAHQSAMMDGAEVTIPDFE